MRKEAIYAVIIGLAVGLSAALAILVLPQKILNLNLASFFSNNNNNGAQVKIEDKNTGANTASAKELVIIEPKDRILAQTSLLTIKGEVLPKTSIVILSAFDQTTVISSNKGKFEAKIKLEQGRNDVQVAAYPDKKEKEVVEIKVYYIQE